MRGLRRASRLLTLLVSAFAMHPSAVAAHPVDDSGTYRWISPPASRKADNVRPEGRRVTIPAGAPFQEFWTPDLQLTLFWPRGALGDAEVTLEATPIDPADLAHLPGGRTANGNAYRVQLAPIERFAQLATVTLQVPTEGTDVFQSTDGRTWRKLRAGPTEAGRAVALMETGGFVVAASSQSEHDVEAKSKVTGIAGFAALPGIAVGVLALEANRRRRRRGTSSTKPSDTLRDGR